MNNISNYKWLKEYMSNNSYICKGLKHFKSDLIYVIADIIFDATGPDEC